MVNTACSNINLAMYQRYAKRHFPSLLIPRLPNTHKGTFGTVGIAGGAVGMAGAPLLAGVAAMFTGCGKTVVAFNQPQLPMPVHAPYPELMLDIAANASKRQDVDVWAVGCGLGRDEAAIQCVQNLWHSDQPRLVLDADALHILADYPDKFRKHKHNDLVLTPHPGEAAHLLNITINQVQDYRQWVARELADRYHCWVVLKGHDTIISSARGLLHTNNTGNAGLATAGSGRRSHSCWRMATRCSVGIAGTITNWAYRANGWRIGGNGALVTQSAHYWCGLIALLLIHFKCRLLFNRQSSLHFFVYIDSINIVD